jgi:drug/metabolite transporter (DMT)-like permease
MKYFEGNIFVNFYIFGAAGIAAVLVGGFCYKRYGLKNSFLISFVMSIIGCIGMLIVQTHLIPFGDNK